ncbi:sortase [Secundilactobacillus kimchicus]|uniref:class A sortase n=1 Tax=Secundilactobacillus kimchicus TaxID=528209 RepID=UPI001C02078B|nr:class A sortase [Secundilactobacillus kimchicus]MBT9670724.1 sortase [Secundilactobacillus kimchicus]
MSKNNRNPVSRWPIRAGFLVLLLISLGLIFNQQIKNWLVSSYQPKITAASVAKNNQKKASFDFKQVKSLDFQTVAQARLNASQIHVIGSILVPKANVHLPIAKGVANTTLALAAGTMRPDQKMGKGNYPLAGHHMTRKDILFSPLYFKAKVGDRVYVTDMKSVYTYRLYQRTFIAATRVDVVNQTKAPIITLITCDATGAGRLMLRGRLVEQQPFKKVAQSIQKQLAGGFNNR